MKATFAIAMFAFWSLGERLDPQLIWDIFDADLAMNLVTVLEQKAQVAQCS